jgi:hypothetical protein
VVGVHGVVLSADHQGRHLDPAVGIVLQNVESEREVERTELVERDGHAYRDRVVKHVSYGIMQPLDGIIERLREWVPAREPPPPNEA